MTQDLTTRLTAFTMNDLLALPQVQRVVCSSKKRICQILCPVRIFSDFLRVYGPGVEDGVLSSFVSAFICDASRAIDDNAAEKGQKGQKGRLKVSVSGPKGKEGQRQVALLASKFCRWI